MLREPMGFLELRLRIVTSMRLKNSVDAVEELGQLKILEEPLPLWVEDSHCGLNRHNHDPAEGVRLWGLAGELGNQIARKIPHVGNGSIVIICDRHPGG